MTEILTYLMYCHDFCIISEFLIIGVNVPRKLDAVLYFFNHKYDYIYQLYIYFNYACKFCLDFTWERVFVAKQQCVGDIFTCF